MLPAERTALHVSAHSNQPVRVLLHQQTAESVSLFLCKNKNTQQLVSGETHSREPGAASLPRGQSIRLPARSTSERGICHVLRYQPLEAVGDVTAVPSEKGRCSIPRALSYEKT